MKQEYLKIWHKVYFYKFLNDPYSIDFWTGRLHFTTDFRNIFSLDLY